MSTYSARLCVACGLTEALGKRISVFRCESGPKHGYGHFVRCLALANELERRNWRCQFAMSSESAETAFVMKSPCNVVELGEGAAAQSLIDAFEKRPDLVFIDDYHLGLEDERQLSGWAGLLARFDDFDNQRHHVGLIVNLGLDASDKHYRDLMLDCTKILTGPAYAPLRRDFSEERHLHRQNSTGPERRICVGFGAIDGMGVTPMAVRAVLAALPEYRIDAFAGSSSASLDVLEEMATHTDALTLHVDCVNPAHTLAQCEFAIGAAGVSALERCALGLPAITVLVSDNQRKSFDALNAAQVIVPIEFTKDTFEKDIGQAVISLSLDDRKRTSLGERALAYCDGRGVERIADIIDEIIH